MAEGFARKYGADVMTVSSAGLAPAAIVQPETVEAMSKKNIDIEEQFPKSVDEVDLASFDLILNMSGMPMQAGPNSELRVWKVEDPMMKSEEVYLQVRDQIESLVMQLIIELRQKEQKAPVARTPMKEAVAQKGQPPITSDKATDHSSRRYRFGRLRNKPDPSPKE